MDNAFAAFAPAISGIAACDTALVTADELLEGAVQAAIEERLATAEVRDATNAAVDAAMDTHALRLCEDAAAATASIASDAADRAAAALAASQVTPPPRWPAVAAVWTAVRDRAKRLYAAAAADPRAPAAGSVLLALLTYAWRWR